MRLIASFDGITSFGRRSWLAWRYVRALGYTPTVAWAKARRSA